MRRTDNLTTLTRRLSWNLEPELADSLKFRLTTHVVAHLVESEAEDYKSFSFGLTTVLRLTWPSMEINISKAEATGASTVLNVLAV